MSTATSTDHSYAAAPALADVLPAPKRRGKIGTFVYRNPSIAAGGFLVAVMICIAIFAPFLGTVDPTSLAPAKRLRPPSETYWFGTDMLGRDIYSRVLYGDRKSVV